MNPITRLILRHVVSAKVKLTPQLLRELIQLEQNQPDANTPGTLAKESAPLRDQFKSATATKERHLTFVTPLPGRWIRRTECAVGVALLLAASLAQAAPGSITFEAANNDFARGKYVEAAREYECVTAQNGFSAPVLFNLANAPQRDGQLGRAILNYERAALLSPNDRDIAANLNYARQKAGFDQASPSPMQRISHVLTMNAWFGLGAASLFLLTVTLPLKQVWPQARGVLIFSGGLAVLALAGAVGALGLRGLESHRVVVTAPAAIAGVSPVSMAQPIFKLRAGEILSLQQDHGAFALIQNFDGQRGWVKSDDITRIIPTRTVL